MLRSIVSGVAGYVAMFAFVFVVMTAAYFALGVERAFKPGVFDVTSLWVVVSVVIGLAGAIVGGAVCAKIAAPASKAPLGLAVAVLILGFLLAIPMLMPPAEGAETNRPADMSMWQAMMQARQPLYVALLNPVIGAAGVLIGGSLGRNRGSVSA